MDGKFWLRFWITVFVCATILGLGVVSCNLHIDYRISQAIERGADPVRARIAFSSAVSISDTTIALMKGN